MDLSTSQKCREVLSQLKEALNAETSLTASSRAVAWRKELTKIEEKCKFPKTVIALVGDTGAGKSRLLNALLECRSVLPTSGMRACTAVVVEVVQNTTSESFEADIEFLQPKEWFDELKQLLQDLSGRDGKIKTNQPGSSTDAYVSYCKVKAVYGKVDTLEVLKKDKKVTRWLGNTKEIKSTTPDNFKQKIEQYIETQEPNDEVQYWPVVKRVILRMPGCDVCSSGAALVDLPSLRDSNVARDKIARDYLRNCTAVWVVDSILRAKDNKTAKDLLSESLWRQLLMDGLYGSIAFICTKTDDVEPSELIKELKLEDKVKDHQDRMSKLENEKKSEKDQILEEEKQVERSIATLKQELMKLNDESMEEKDTPRKRLEDKETELRVAENKLEELVNRNKLSLMSCKHS